MAKFKAEFIDGLILPGNFKFFQNIENKKELFTEICIQSIEVMTAVKNNDLSNLIEQAFIDFNVKVLSNGSVQIVPETESVKSFQKGEQDFSIEDVNEFDWKTAYQQILTALINGDEEDPICSVNEQVMLLEK